MYIKYINRKHLHIKEAIITKKIWEGEVNDISVVKSSALTLSHSS